MADEMTLTRPTTNGKHPSEALLLVQLQVEFAKLRQALAALQHDELDVRNLDEVRAGVRAELNRLIDKFDIKFQRVVEAMGRFKYEVQLPEEVNLHGLGGLVETLTDLAQLLRDKDFAPVVDVRLPDVVVPDIKVPDIHVPEIRVPRIEVPPAQVEVDLSALLEALKPLGFLSNRAGKPLSVRLSDGAKFVKAMQDVVAKQERAIQVLSQGGGMSSDEFRVAFGDLTTFGTQTSGFKTLADATTAAQVSSTSVRVYGVELTALGGRIAVGDSSARMDSGNEQGLILYPGNPPNRYLTNNLNKLYAAGAAGTRLCYVYYS